jgi:hypothetical protein
MQPPAGKVAFRSHGRVEGDAMKPTGQRLYASDGAGFEGQDEESGLEGVLSILVVVQHMPANAQDHCPVAPHQGGESRLIVLRQEILEELEASAAFGGLPGR